MLRLGSVYTDLNRLNDPSEVRFKGQTEQAIGIWMRPKSHSRMAKANKGQPPQFSPEQICLDVGRIQAPARLAWAFAFCADFARTVFCFASGRPAVLILGRS